MADGYNPFQSALNPNMRNTSLWDLRMMSSANRMETPFERGARSSYGHQGISGNPMLAQMMGMGNQPDYSQFTYDPAMRQRAMDAGVQPLEASQVKHNTFLPNTGFFGNHPRLSAALESGVYGALAAHGGQTIGDSIQGSLEGIVGGQRLRQGVLNQQFARPFEAAGMIEGLQDMKQKRDLQSADIEHLRAENQKLGRPDHDFRAFGVSRNDPEIATIDNTTGNVKYDANPLYDPSQTKAARALEDISLGTREQLRIMGVDPATATTAQLAAANQKASAQLATRAGNAAGAGQNARNDANASKDEAARRQKWIQTQSAKPGATWLAAGISPDDPDAVKKLGKYYDDNFGPAGQPTAPEAEGAQGTQSNPHVIQ